MSEKRVRTNLLSGIIVAIAGLVIGFGIVAAGQLWLVSGSSENVTANSARPGAGEQAYQSPIGSPNPVAISNRQSIDPPQAPVDQAAANRNSSTATFVAHADLVPMSGGGPDRLTVRCDSGEGSSSSGSDTAEILRIACSQPQAAFGGMYKQINAAPFRGKRLRFSAELMAEGLEGVDNIEGVGAVWIRIDAASGPVVDNGRNQGIRGSTGWTLKEVSAEVPHDASLISIGFWMQGRGQLLARALQYETN